jgi:hypothetical protein
VDWFVIALLSTNEHASGNQATDHDKELLHYKQLIFSALYRERFPDCTFAVAIETTKGPLINALINYTDVIIYPINPAALANYRKAFAHGGCKNEPSDAKLLADFLQPSHCFSALATRRRSKSVSSC